MSAHDDVAKRFWDCADKSGACWAWRRGRGSHGYGQFYVERGKPLLAHRFAWRLERGEIPEGMKVLHRCDNKRCVNPAHLFLGTQADNMLDMRNKGRAAPLLIKRGEASPTCKVTDFQVGEIRKRWRRGTRQAPGNAMQLAAEFGITRARVYQIAKGLSR